MKQKTKLLSAIVVLFVLAFCSAKAQVTAQDGRTYKTVKIGNQTWMAENLNVSTYRNGDSIPQAQEKGKLLSTKFGGGWLNMPGGAWCYYETANGIDSTYGKLYNWFVVIDSRGLAPAGWHIPSFNEWAELRATLGGENNAGKKLKATTGWEKNGNGTNESGFEAYPGGYRMFGVFVQNGFSANWWTSTKYIGMVAYFLSVNARKGKFETVIDMDSYIGRYGLSVRCIKD